MAKPHMKEKHFWLVLTIIILGLSAILLVVFMYIFFVFIPQPVITTSIPVALATAFQTIPATETTLTGENTASTPVIIIPSSTQTSPAALTPSAAATQKSKLSPDEFIRLYYSLINQAKYEITFAMLSDNFKDNRHCCNPDGSYQIEPYIEWWNSVAEVSVYAVDTKQLEDTKANVIIQISYLMNDGRVVDTTHTFNLIADPSEDSWLIN